MKNVFSIISQFHTYFIYFRWLYFLENKNKYICSWFTLVELIVVVTILAILWTIWFISFQWFSMSARDSKRLWDINMIQKSLLFIVESWQQLPLPEWNMTEIYSSWTLVSIQWDFTEHLWNNSRVFWDLQDPLDNNFFTYTVSRNRLKFAIGWLTESPVSWNKSIFPQTYADNRNLYIKWDKVWIYFNGEDVPVQQVWVENIDIVHTSENYKVYFSTNNYLEWDKEQLMFASPTASCKRIFETTSNYSWNGEYIINPRWEDQYVYCHSDFLETNFYDYIVDWDFEVNTSENWDTTKIISDAAMTGDYGFRQVSRLVITSNNYTYVDPSKNYNISVWLRSSWEELSSAHVWFIEYDKNFVQIRPYDVWAVPNTETQLMQDVNSNDTSLVFNNIDSQMCEVWENHSRFLTHGKVAFDVDISGSYNDLPNRNLSKNIPQSSTENPNNTIWMNFTGLENNGDTCILFFWWEIWQEYPAWTNIRMHLPGGWFNYRATNGWVTVPNQWTLYEWWVSWESLYGISNLNFRRGTRFIKPLILANHANSTSDDPNHWKNALMELDIDDIKLEKF